DVDGARRRIEFLNLPRDQAAHPLAGQVVEIIPWGALLPNQEKVAEFQGQLFTVATGFDPADGSLTLANEVPEAWVDWLDEHDEFRNERDPADQQQYLYLRLWTGGSGDAAAPDHAFTLGEPVALAGTGLSAVFSDHGLPGDYWIIAVRPHTPDRVVPWELLDGEPPVGPRYFFAPLALIRWSQDIDDTPQPQVQDCRERFQPLCEVRGCCTLTVGDSVSSHGLFASIEEAIDFLPPTGGKICLLPGLHRANVRIVGRHNIVIKGCGKQTQVIPEDSNRAGSVFHIIDSQCITLEHMDLATLEGTAISLEGSELDRLKEIEIHHNRILAYRETIRVVRGVEMNIHHNRIRMLDKPGAGVAIAAWAEDSLIEGNDIGVVPAEQVPPPEDPGGETPDPADPCADPVLVYANRPFLVGFFNRLLGVLITALPLSPFKAQGGIQIAAASERIKVLENKIHGGAGNGITLGGALEPAPVVVESAGEPEHLIDHKSGQIWGEVTGPAGLLPGITLAFVRTDGMGSVLTPATDSKGIILFSAQPAQYSVAVMTPGYRIENI
ncbi:MAG: hypothetical protein U9P11_07220, partial [Pseudomonadota bacterium]|nr:hypothetical protein [Pseudomonadota bacterium]